MTKNVEAMLKVLKSREYRANRKQDALDITKLVAGKNAFEIEAIRMKAMLENEKTVIFENDIFGFNRYQKLCPVFLDENGEMSGQWGPGNITPDYALVMEKGFISIISDIDKKLTTKKSHTDYYKNLKVILTVILEFCGRYEKNAEKIGNIRLASALKKVPAKPPESFYEACLFFKIIVFSLRAVCYSHVTIGRFDQYMYRYFDNDIKNGLSREDLLETLEMLFISLNIDSDTYAGVQQGDNGQSMVLGGFDKNGNSMFNELSALCMDASLELCLIDPKINLRVGKNTPTELYEYGTRLTKKGLGFPQYCNDDIVVPGLVNLGYDYEDALNYTVAACWEYIIPGLGADIPNIQVFNFPLSVNYSVHKNLLRSSTFDELMLHITEDIIKDTDIAMAEKYNQAFGFSLYLSLFMDGCFEKGKELSENAAKYNNSGCHGAGIAAAADALAAVKTVIYDEKSITKEKLLKALDTNFEGCPELRNKLLSCPKMGNNDNTTDNLAGMLMDTFAKEMNGKPNGRGGIYRAGTGSAMEYITSAAKCPATADGRKNGEAYGCSFSPSILTKLKGPLSVIQSFTKYDLKNIINGGPLTIEMHDTVFRNTESEKKVAQLVKAFIDLGGHQLQINAVNRDRLLAAKEHPEQYPNLIVRVWGWSGYFCELDKKYQDHIIKRTEFSI